MLRRLASGAALAAVAVVMLAGCTPPEPVETTPAPSPSESATTPASTLEAEAIDMAERFLSLTDQGFATGSLPSAELRSIASAELVTQLETEVEAFALQGLNVEGQSRLDSPRLVDVATEPLPGESFELLACIDTSGVTTTDEEGEIVSGGVTRQPRVFEFLSGEPLSIRATTPPAAGTELPGCGA